MIYAKIVRELCLKILGKKKKDPLTIQYIGHLANALSDLPIEKYEDPGNPIVTINVQGTLIPNTLIELGVAINVMTLQIVHQLNIPNIQPTPTMLELADRSKVKPEGVLDDEVVTLDSWEYPVAFFILQPKSTSGGHPIVLGRPWLATTDAFIECRSGDMFLSQGNLVKQVSLYPSAKSITEVQDVTWFDKEPSDGEISHPIFTIDQIGSLKQPSEENHITRFLCDVESIHHDDSTNMDLEHIFKADV